MVYQNFDTPSTISQLITLLNASNHWNFLVENYEDCVRVININDNAIVFTADTNAEIFNFLSGCFLVTFWGTSLEGITDIVNNLNGEKYWHWCIRAGHW